MPFFCVKNSRHLLSRADLDLILVALVGLAAKYELGHQDTRHIDELYKRIRSHLHECRIAYHQATAQTPHEK